MHSTRIFYAWAACQSGLSGNSVAFLRFVVILSQFPLQTISNLSTPLAVAPLGTEISMWRQNSQTKVLYLCYLLSISILVVRWGTNFYLNCSPAKYLVDLLWQLPCLNLNKLPSTCKRNCKFAHFYTYLILIQQYLSFSKCIYACHASQTQRTFYTCMYLRLHYPNVVDKLELKCLIVLDLWASFPTA